MNDMTRPEGKHIRNESGIEVKPLYTAADVEATGGLEMIGEPGGYPYTRGIHPMMYGNTEYMECMEYMECKK